MGHRATGDRKKQFQFLVICCGALLFIQFLSSTDYHSLSLVVNLKMGVGLPPYTSIIIPPVGQIRAQTHWLPVQLNLELRTVNLALLRNLVFSTPEAIKPLEQEIITGFKYLLYYFSAKLLLLGACGALFALIFFGVRDPKKLGSGALGGFVFVLALLIVLYFNYDLHAFKKLEYEGIIEAAPWVFDLAWQSLAQVEELGARMQVLARNLYSALEQLESLGPLALVQGDLVAVHVSDIHNNPVAYDFLAQVIESFPVDLIFDTGDLTDWGTSLEAEITARIAELKIPYVFVSGNHETAEVLARLAELENVVLVDQLEQTILGIKVAGIGDLAALNQLPTAPTLEDLAKQAQELNSFWAQIENRPQVFLAHNHRLAKAIEPGLFPLVLYGHTHVLELQQIDGTIYNNAGTTGAAGIRGFQAKEPLPYSLSLLYFAQDEQGEFKLQAIDGVHVTGLGQSFSLQRTFIEASRNLELDVENLR